MFKHNAKAVLNTQRVDKDGNYPLRIRTTIQRKVSYYPTGIMLKQNQLLNGEVIKHPNKDLLNIQVRTRITQIEKELLEASISGEAVIKRRNQDLKFVDYASKKIKSWESSQSSSTIRHKKSYLNKISEFNPHLKLTAVSKETLTKLEDFCREKGNITNTVWSCSKFVKTIINAAVEDGTLPKNPLKGFKGARYSDPMREVLTETEIKKLETFADNKRNNPKLINVASWFILGCYTGLRYQDMTTFPGIINNKVILKTQKTGSVVSIFATNQIKRAWKRITSPIYSNQKCNEYIGAVCAIIGIDKRISFHNSRHSFSVNFLEKGGDVFLLSKILGHSTVKTTAIYSKVSNPLLDREMQKVFGKKSGK